MSLAVIESRWWGEGNDSVRGFFDTLVALRELEPNAYYYEMFNNRASLGEVVPRLARRVKAIYIAAHGDQNGISGAESLRRNDISRRAFRDIIRAGVTQPRGGLDGVYVGSCGFMNAANAIFLFENYNERRVRIKWLTGYSKEIEFIDSTAIDIFFWNEYLALKQGTALQRARAVACKMRTVFKREYLREKMGFDILARARGPDGGIQSLIWR